MGWEPPTKEAFDNLWLRPDEADMLGVTDPEHWLHTRLKGGITLAVARTAFDSSDKPPKTFIAVPRAVWRAWDRNDRHFWNDGTLVHHEAIGSTGYDGTSEYTFLDVRFDPETLKSAPSKTAPEIPEAPREAERPKNAKAPAGAELDRFCKLMLEHYGSALTEDRAVKLVRAVYDEHQIGRDSFLARFRVIRGHKKRGKTTLNG